MFCTEDNFYNLLSSLLCSLSPPFGFIIFYLDVSYTVSHVMSSQPVKAIRFCSSFPVSIIVRSSNMLLLQIFLDIFGLHQTSGPQPPTKPGPAQIGQDQTSLPPYPSLHLNLSAWSPIPQPSLFLSRLSSRCHVQITQPIRVKVKPLLPLELQQLHTF